MPEILNNAPADDAPRDNKQKWAADTAERLVGKRAALLRARRDKLPLDGSLTESDTGPVMWNVINRYARTKPPKDPRDFGITVVACHANGLHKEVSFFAHVFRLTVTSS